MGNIFSTLIDYMEAEEWRYEIIEGETVLRFHVKTKSGRLLCYAEVHEEKSWLLFYSYLPVNVPAAKLPIVSEFVNRANYGMRIGNFEVDYSDGEVRYKTSIDIEGGELTAQMIDNLLQANLSTMDRYFNGLMGTVYSDRSAATIIDEIEQPHGEVANDDDEDDDDDDDFDSEDSLDSDADDDEEEERLRG